MLFNLLLAGITVSLFFFFVFLVVFNSFFMIPVEIENARLKLALTIPTGALVTVANDAIEMLAVVIRLMTCKNSQKKQSLHEKRSFPLRISSVNVTKSARNCGFGHIY